MEALVIGQGRNCQCRKSWKRIRACPHCFADMPKTHSIEYLLESLVDGESLDGVLTSLMVIAEKKAQSQHSNKATIKQWSRAAGRLKDLREWCAKFGPGSDCR